MTFQKILLGFEPKKENLLAAIKEINKKRGCFDYQATKEVARYFSLEPSAVFSAASFYDQIETKKQTGLVIKVCDSANCQEKNADAVISQIETLFGVKEGDLNNPKIKIQRISCVGRCLEGPIVIVNGTVYEKMDSARIEEVLKGYL